MEIIVLVFKVRWLDVMVLFCIWDRGALGFAGVVHFLMMWWSMWWSPVGRKCVLLFILLFVLLVWARLLVLFMLWLGLGSAVLVTVLPSLSVLVCSLVLSVLLIILLARLRDLSYVLVVEVVYVVAAVVLVASPTGSSGRRRLSTLLLCPWHGIWDTLRNLARFARQVTTVQPKQMTGQWH